MSGIVWVITASIVFICIAVVAIFYKLTKLQEETREAYLKFDSYRMEKWSYRYHEAEAEYNNCVNRYNGQIEKVPDKYVAGIFGLKKQKKLQ